MQENINIPDSNITTNLSFRQLVLMNIQQLTNFPYIEKDFDALTDYELLCLVVKFLNDVITNQNEQNASITRMYESFLALQTYVNNTKDTLEDAFNNLDNYVRYYFDNLDVQQEINNKLDQMLEDGVLEQIIEQFIQSTAIWCFDTVADMQAATNLIDGSFAKTLGYYSVNDGGGATYKITDTASLTDYQETVGSLYATLNVENSCNVKQFGAYGDNTHDDTTSFTNAISFIKNHNIGELIIPNGTYYITDEIEIEELNNLTINCYGTINRESETTGKSFINIYSCNNIKLNSINVYSTRDKTESPPAGHTRVSSLGSNIRGIFILNSSNIEINNCKCNNLATDIDISGGSGTSETISDNIVINNLISTNCSMPIFSAYVNNFYINDSYITPATNMGSGDHCVYMGQYSNKCFINNSTFISPDNKFGSLIHPSQSVSAESIAYPNYININNSYLKGNKILEALCNYVNFSNCYLESYDNTESNMITNFRNTIVKINNCNIIPKYVFCVGGGSTSSDYENQITIENCNIKSDSTQIIFYNQTGNSHKSKMLINNNNIYVKAILYYNSADATGETIMNNNIITFDSDSQKDCVFSNRSNNVKVRFNNNIVKCLDAKYDGVAYNPSVSSINSYIYNNILYNMNKIAFASQVDYVVNHGNYINDTLQT